MPGEPRDTLGGCDLSSHLGPFLLEPTQLGDSVHHEDTPILEHLCPPNHMISLILFLVWKRVGVMGRLIPALPSSQDHHEDQEG